MQKRYTSRLVSGTKYQEEISKWWSLSPVLTEAWSAKTRKGLPLLTDLFSFSSSLPGVTVHTPDHQTMALANMKSNLTWRHWADISIKSAHWALIKQTSQPESIEKVRKKSWENEREPVKEAWLLPRKDTTYVRQNTSSLTNLLVLQAVSASLCNKE